MTSSRFKKIKWISCGVFVGVVLFDWIFVGFTNVDDLLANYDRVAFPRKSQDGGMSQPLGDVTSIFIEADRMNVKVTFSDEPETPEKPASITWQVRGEMPESVGDSHLVASVESTKLKLVATVAPRSFWVRQFPSSVGVEASMTLVLPRRFSGELTVRGGQGRISLEKGSIAKFDVRSRSGGVIVSEMEVHVVDVVTESGRFSFDGKSQNVSVKTKSGEIDAVFRDAAENFDRASFHFVSESGRTSIEVPPKASLAVLLDSLSGAVTSEFEFDGKSERTARRLTGVANGGHGTLEVKNWSGAIVLRNLKD